MRNYFLYLYKIKNMKEQSCPIVYDRVDNKLTRINALITFIGLFAFVFLGIKWIILLVTADFAVRVFFGIKYSPMCYGIKWSLNKMNSEPHLVNAGPKKFAAKIGLTLTSILSLLYIFNFNQAAEILGVVSIIAIGAEAFLGYCVACKVYNILRNMGIEL